jgi:hypothetical protein
MEGWGDGVGEETEIEEEIEDWLKCAVKKIKMH